MTKSTGEDWLGAPALAKELGITLRTMYRILDTGDLPAYKLGRVIRIKRADLDDFLDRVKVRPGDLAHLYPPGDAGDPKRKR
ncbi:MAG: helix-turn-helix domain-containing protein [Actinomycetota bacterium]|nr:helix-turn-helix domain-containing protein [Actinomycetota bacterium]